ncbi:MAG: peptidase U7 [Coxiellaceae bacterium]|nr:peptidase U7 [Coxiellaceae bacterium]|tara:strand:+ start:9332 stop:10285 length:954 start_codon:yes stop_codon:yes gene_type:complete
MSEKTELPVGEAIIKALVDDRRRDRRWRIIRFSLIAAIVLLYAIVLSMHSSSTYDHVQSGKPYVSLVRLSGVIMPEAHMSANVVNPVLYKAFTDKNSKGVLIEMNSPGGSAVQSSLIYDQIMRLKHAYHKKVVVVGEDALASGAYLIASAADQIYVDPDTITGSIGVIMSGFGFTDAIKKIGITRRVLTAGENKDRLDAFEPLDATDVAKAKQLLNDAHEHFIKDVLAGRKGRLKGDKAVLFSGDFWSGSRAVQLGLVDGTGSVPSVMHHEFSTEFYKLYEPRLSFLQSLVGSTQEHLSIPGLHAATTVLAQWSGVS